MLPMGTPNPVCMNKGKLLFSSVEQVEVTVTFKKKTESLDPDFVNGVKFVICWLNSLKGIF